MVTRERSLSDFWREAKSDDRVLEMTSVLMGADSLLGVMGSGVRAVWSTNGGSATYWLRMKAGAPLQTRVFLDYEPIAHIRPPFPGTAVDEIIGYSAHEGGHCLWSDPDGFDHIKPLLDARQERNVREAMANNPHAEKSQNCTCPICRALRVDNILEDAYIDYHVAEKWPVLGEYIKWARRRIQEKRPIDFESIARMPNPSRRLIQNLWIACSLYDVPLPEKMTAKVRRAMQVLMTYSVTAVQSTGHYDRLKNSVEAFAYLEQNFQDDGSELPRKPAPPKPQTPAQKKPEPKAEPEKGKSEKADDTKAGKDDTKPAQDETKGSPDDAKPEKSDTEPESEDKGKAEAQKPEDAEPGKEKGEGEPEKEEAGEEGGETGESGDGDEKGEGDEDGGDAAGEGGDKGETGDGAGDSEDEGEGEGSGQGEGAGEGEGGGGQGQDEGPQENGHFSGDPADSKQDGKGEGGGQQGGDGQGKVGDLDEFDIREMGEVPEELLNEIMDAISHEIEDISRSVAEVMNQRPGDVIASTKKGDFDGPRKQQIESQVESEIQRMRRVFDRQQDVKTRYLRGQLHGQLDGRKLARVGTGNLRVYQTKQVLETPDLAVGFLGDASGSMSSNMGILYASACIFSESLIRKQGVNFLAMVYTGGGFQVQTTRICDRTMGKLCLGNVDVGGGTPSGPAIASMKVLMDRMPEKTKVIIHFTDGMPDDSWAVKTAVEACRKAGYTVWAIGLRGMERSLRDQYGEGNWETLGNIKELPEKIAELVKKLVATR